MLMVKVTIVEVVAAMVLVTRMAMKESGMLLSCSLCNKRGHGGNVHAFLFLDDGSHQSEVCIARTDFTVQTSP